MATDIEMWLSISFQISSTYEGRLHRSQKSGIIKGRRVLCVVGTERRTLVTPAE